MYDEEITGQVVAVTKTADTGLTFTGLRLYLASPDVLHNVPGDDDRSAITFWFERGDQGGEGKVRNTLLALPQPAAVRHPGPVGGLVEIAVMVGRPGAMHNPVGHVLGGPVGDGVGADRIARPAPRVSTFHHEAGVTLRAAPPSGPK